MKKKLKLIPLMMLLLSMTGADIAFAEDYSLWVGGVQVTDANKNKIPIVRGNASFDSTTKTLTLTDAYVMNGSEASCIRSDFDGLIIRAVGVNILKSTSSGITFTGNMDEMRNFTITGPGTLTIEAPTSGISMGHCRLKVSNCNGLTINSPVGIMGALSLLFHSLNPDKVPEIEYEELAVFHSNVYIMTPYTSNDHNPLVLTGFKPDGVTTNMVTPNPWKFSFPNILLYESGNIPYVVQIVATDGGDVNSDGKVDINDVVAIINQMAGTAFWKGADVNGDSIVDINDVVCVINIMANGWQSFPDPPEQPKKSTYTVKGVSFKMVDVKGGTFEMGSNVKEAGENEKPVHQAALGDYAIGETEVTQALWQAVMGSNPSEFKGDNLPVENISWNDCQTFIARLNALTGEQFRLPTEAEWEYAARGGKKSQNCTYSGSNDAGAVAWYQNNSDEKTHIVATKVPNELGIYDMSGNVNEWCQDWYGSYSSNQTDLFGPSSGQYRVYRGGDHRGQEYHSGSWDCRVSARSSTFQTSKATTIGLRLVLGPQIPTTYTVNGVSFKMVDVKGDIYKMGLLPSGGYRVNVTLSDFAIGQTEVTQELWMAVMGSNPSYFSSGSVGLPVEQVSWDDCQTFITKLNKLTGKKFRLPTEAEWEYAARGGDKSKGYEYSGSDNVYDVAWHSVNSSKMIHPVAMKVPNELGIYDMSGNVCEWCYDWWSESRYDDLINPSGPISGQHRICCGGDYSYSPLASVFMVTNRGGKAPSSREKTLGLRLVLGRSLPTIYTVNGVSFAMVDVEGGTFMMGADDSDSVAADYEKPAHQVTVSNFAIGQTEVTRALWGAVMNDGTVDSPVARGSTTWEDCAEFIVKLNLLTHKKFRFLTEAEWEYAARGGNMSQGYLFSGSNNLDEVAWYPTYNDDNLHAVGTKKPNELGLYDMSGNVLEWCSDWYGPYTSKPQTDPTGPSSGSTRVQRSGGGYNNMVNEYYNCRITKRWGAYPDGRYAIYEDEGFRLALTP